MPIDSDRFRKVLGHFPTGVTVVTTMPAGGEPVGFTIGSFTSVSLDPPLVGFLAMIDSQRWRQINSTGSFCVNVLAAEQGELCWRFAKTDIASPFDGVEWRPSPNTRSPILAGAIAWIDCVIEQVVDAGDHHFVLGRVLELEHADPDTDPQPLLYFRGKLGDFRGRA